MAQYADILLPLALNLETLTYRVEEGMTLCEGDYVAVEMGNNTSRFYTGVVWRLHNEKPNFKTIRHVVKRLYEGVQLPPQHRKFWAWITDYYLAPMGDVMRCALPAMIKPSAIDEQEFIKAEYTPAQEIYIKLEQSRNTIEEQMERLERRSLKQGRVMRALMAIDKGDYTADGLIPRRLVECDLCHLKALQNKGLLSFESRERRIEQGGSVAFTLPILSPHQQEALREIDRSHIDLQCTLLHGVTGSGKTEIYIHLIARALAAGDDVLLLLPEIALTTQLITRMERIFGSRVIPYHSKLAPRRRTEIFMQMSLNHDGGNLLVGARSAIFVPLNRLALIVVDEEHDSSYKQVDPSPRYNGRDCAHILANLYGAKVVLGSATPSLESWINSHTGKFGLATLSQRFAGAMLPKIIISDRQRAGKRRERRGHFNLDLLTKIEERLERGEQSILFQNRRGFAPYVECGECGWVARCPNCNVSLTMHKSSRRLICHYCDHTQDLVQRCPSCVVGEVLPVGFGTEKIEEQLGEFLPSARIVRLDRDTSSSMASFERIVDGFAQHQSDIMVGTQMVVKGFDFPDVTLVGMLNADNLLLNPDFRAEERAFSTMLQVAGRAGRRADSHGEVVIQTSQPQHRIIKFVLDNDFEAMARTLLQEREAFFYPPYSRITLITLRHTDWQRLTSGANALSTLLKERFGVRVKGPVAPPVDRIHNEWIVNFILKIESGASSARGRKVLREVVEQWRAQSEFRAIKLIFNVDPQ